MDWSKAKSILILIFLALNLFLLAFIMTYSFGNGVSKETVSNTVDILSGRGVKLECEIPLYKTDTPRLVYESGRKDMLVLIKKLLGEDSYSEEDIKAGSSLTKGSRKITINPDNTLVYTNDTPSDNIDLSNREKLEKQVKKLASNAGIKISAYMLDDYIANPDGSISLVFIEKYKKFPVYGNRLAITVVSEGIRSIEFNCRKIKGLIRESPVKVIPVYQILLKEYNTGKSAVILKIDLGYRGMAGHDPEMLESSEGPVWRIVTREDGARYFEAGTGKEIK